MEILPGILATTESEYKELTDVLGKSAALEGGWLQLDLMDGKFVDNTSISAVEIQNNPVNLRIEAQLMVEDPVGWVEKLSACPIERFIAPVELGKVKIDAFLMAVKEKGIKVGLSINPETEVGLVRAWIDQLETVLIMSVKPGFGGQEFIESSYKRVEELRKLAKNVRIEVDGGVTPEITEKLAEIGADAVVLGADRLIEKGIDETLEEIWEITTSS